MISAAEQSAIEAALSALVGEGAKISEPLAAEGYKKRDVLARYELPAQVGCEGCLPEEELALNPGCKTHGVVYAILESSQAKILALPLKESGCEQRVLQWGIEDNVVVLEAVYSRVVERGSAAAGKVGRPLEIARSQVAAVTRLFQLEGQGLSEPGLELQLAQWRARPGKTREPPVRSSLLVGNYHSPMVIQLLPCLDPWSEEACNDYVRRRKVIDVP